MLDMTGKALNAAETHARRGPDQLRQRQCRSDIADASATLADVDVDQNLERATALAQEFAQYADLIGVIDNNADVGLACHPGQTFKLGAIGHRRRQQQAGNAGLRKGLDLPNRPPATTAHATLNL